MSNELKPCPFCGAKNTQVRYIGFAYAKIACGYVAGYRGECCECHAITAAFDYEKDAIAAWNRRANDEQGKTMDNSIELLEEWQERLFLNEWRIIIRPKCKPDDMTDGCWGSTEWVEVNKTARIDIVDPECLTDKMIPFDFEEVLVHELLHLKFCLLSDNSDDNMESRYVHQLIDEMARSLVDAKRYCADGERKDGDE